MPAVKPCNPEVEILVAHLKTTGTGQDKLDSLTELGRVCSSKAQFLELAAKRVPAGTMAKIFAFDHSEPVASPEPQQPIEAAKAVEVESPSDEAVEEPTEEPTEEVSEVADINAKEAIDKISRMTSKDHLEHIVLSESRKTVVEAAQKRLDELGAG